MATVLRALRGETIDSPRGCWAIAMVVAFAIGMTAARYPFELQGFIVVPLLMWALVRTMRKSFRTHAERAYFQWIAEWGLVLRVLFVGIHLVIGLWFYRGEIDFVGSQMLASSMLGQLVREPFNLESLAGSGHGGLLDVGVGTLFTLTLLVVIGAVTGPTLLGMFFGCVVLGTAGALLFLRAFQHTFPGSTGERFLAAALFLLPSVSFWSIFLGKDVMVFFLMGATTYCVARLLQRIELSSVLGLAMSLGLLLGVRPHIGIALGVGMAMALVCRPLPLTGSAALLGPVMRVLVAVPIAAVTVFVGTTGFFWIGVADVTVDTLAELAYEHQRGFVTTEAASALPLAIESGDPGQVARFIPLGVVTLLFRPFPWEAHNVLAVVASVENMVLAGLILWRRRVLVHSLKSVFRQPFLLYTLIVFIVASVALSFSWQLGVMARFRTMVLPFLMILLAGSGSRERA